MYSLPAPCWRVHESGERMSDVQRNLNGEYRYVGSLNYTIDLRPKNWLTPVALVLLREENSYGYELMERIGEFGFEEINPGTLYRTLRQMENQGLCESR